MYSRLTLDKQIPGTTYAEMVEKLQGGKAEGSTYSEFKLPAGAAHDSCEFHNTIALIRVASKACDGLCQIWIKSSGHHRAFAVYEVRSDYLCTSGGRFPTDELVHSQARIVADGDVVDR